MKRIGKAGQRNEKWHHYLRSLLLVGFTLLLAKLIWTEQINLYLAPRMRVFAYVTLGVFVVLTFAGFRQAVGSKEGDCACAGEHRLPGNGWKSAIVYGLFLLPLVMGFAMPEKILGSEVAEKRGLNLLSGESKVLQAAAQPAADGESGGAASGAEANLQAGPAEPERSPSQASSAADAEVRERFAAAGFGDVYTDIAVRLYQQPIIHLDEKLFLDGLTAFDLFPREFAGHKLRTMGFVYRQPDFKQNQFVVARFSVSCCTADASVYGLLAEAPDAGQLATDSWVEVDGTLRLRSINGFDMLVLEVDSVKPVEAPEDPYVYFNFGTLDSTKE